MRRILMMMVLAGTVITACSAGGKGNIKDGNEQKAQTTQQKNTEPQAETATTSLAPDFTLNDLNGKPLALSSLRGKYVVIDFWGSWCVWCIKGMPKMKEYYKKYQGKLEILGLDCGDSEADWKNAVKQLNLPWKHVYVPEGSSVFAAYNIQGFPTKVIVDPEGNLVKAIVGESPEFYGLLDSLLAN